MTALPKVSATETADLRDVHKRLAGYKVVYKGVLVRVEYWVKTKIYPRWF
jgi:hypothetical protein